MKNETLIGVSNRHIHLSKEHSAQLFGERYQLKVRRRLRQSGQFAAEEKVALVGKEILEARVVGPLRAQTQVEILQEDKEKLGIKAPIKVSGNLEGTPGIKVRGPKGEVDLECGVIVAAKHVHMSTDEISEFGLEGVKYVDIQTETNKIFKRVPVRMGDKHISEFHLDKDEARVLGIKSGQKATIIKRHK